LPVKISPEVGIVGQHVDALQRRLGLQAVDAGHKHRAVFLDIDRDFELFFQIRGWWPRPCR
jgi:hypothetical protein